MRNVDEQADGCGADGYGADGYGQVVGTTWRATGLVWHREGAALEWWAPESGRTREGALPLGAEPAFVVGPDRRCIGLWRSGRRIPCPMRHPLAPGSRSTQCGDCARLDRRNSVAADTLLDDPRPYAVYLAHHGSAGIKVGITRADRGLARLLEQGAFASIFLSEGTLPSARRVEHLLGVALGLPDRASTVRKRVARAAPGTAQERAAALLAELARTTALAWPEGQQRHAHPTVVDHCATYGLPDTGFEPDAAVEALRPGDGVAGTAVCRIGTDLYLAVPASGLVLLDTRLLSGWSVSRAAAPARFTAPLTPVPRVTEPQQQPGLF